MMTHRLQVLAGCPYFTTSKVKTEDDRKFQQVAWALKDGKTITYSGKYIPAAQWFADWVAQHSQLHDPGFFSSSRILVPLPSSSVTLQPPQPSHWPCLDLAQRLAAANLGATAAPLLLRRTAVESSKTARKAGRQPPSVQQHLDSFDYSTSTLSHLIHTRAPITLIDDIVSAGRTSMAAMLKLRQQGFKGDISLFAAFFTVYDPGVRRHFRGQVVWHEGRETSFREEI